MDKVGLLNKPDSDNKSENMTPVRQLTVSVSRLLVFGGIFAGMTALGIYIVYQQLAGQSLSFDMRLLSWKPLLMLVVLSVLYYVSDGLRLYYTIRALGEQISFQQLFRLVFINIFFSNITPMATGGGFAQIWYLQRHGMKLGTATAATTIRTLLAVIFIFGLTPVFLLTLDELKNQPLLSGIGKVMAVLIVMYLGFFWTVLVHSRWLAGFCCRVLRLLHRANLLSEQRLCHWQYKVRREMLRFARCFRLYLSGPARYIWLSVFYTLLFLLCLFAFPIVLLEALGYDVNYLVVTGLLVVITFIMYFAPTPGASGVSEGVFATLFRGMVGAEHLLLVTIGWRVLTVYIGMFAGIIVTQAELLRNRKANE